VEGSEAFLRQWGHAPKTKAAFMRKWKGGAASPALSTFNATRLPSTRSEPARTSLATTDVNSTMESSLTQTASPATNDQNSESSSHFLLSGSTSLSQPVVKSVDQNMTNLLALDSPAHFHHDGVDRVGSEDQNVRSLHSVLFHAVFRSLMNVHNFTYQTGSNLTAKNPAQSVGWEAVSMRFVSHS
jgi:hypothetical protein